MRSQIYVGSIREKHSAKRRPFVVIGDFQNRREFIDAIKSQLCEDGPEYDYRTIRWYQEIETSTPTVLFVHQAIDDGDEISFREA